MESTKDFPRIKLLGKKAISDPAISIMFLKAITDSIKASWNRSTISAHIIWKRFSFSNFLNTARSLDLVRDEGGGRTSFNLDELITDQKRE